MASYAPVSFLLAVMLLTVEARILTDLDPPLKPSSETNNYDGYKFDSRESDIPTEEFIANINKGSSETNGFSGEHSYVTVPQDKEEKDGNDFYYPDDDTKGMDASAEDRGFELTGEEDNLLNEKEATTNGYGKEAQGMSDTRTLEHGKYYYEPTRDNRGKREYFGNIENKPKYDDEFRPLKDFEYNPQNQVGFVP